MGADGGSTENETGAATRTARVPKYYRLKRHLLDMTDTMPPGTPVPPERTLAAEFDTSRTTVRQALQELVVEGRLERIQGKGTFVAKPKVSQALQLTSYTEDMRAQGLEPTSQLLDIGYVTADDTLAGLLDITTGGRVLRIERLRLASGEPMAIETTHLSAKRFPALRRSLVKYTSLYTALAEVYDVRLAEAEETIETSLATPREAGLLGTDVGLPMLMLSRHSIDGQGEPVEWVRSVYRGDRYKFVARLKRPTD
ncbi:GntR family transcriptional regulator [Streptomyces sp. NPDC059118]|jgi:GntR family transcriptional regulator|uniref:GntR family transcriptional regulator n=1 Tax=unclassified Streptomyces TaxID=2593676 RepID=UPI00081B66A7|nr:MULTISPECIES: GntR family transcriptional regulator [unclassified Streptomyces]MEE1750826.1 GntR family transcriptional regulator [Streptomyces sp. JV184]MYQ88713.1 UTRA domain-containing protein [Streptomyces sp. SID4936]SCE56394.1 transcriptional regulator, GntR family [Streptomyces sp. DvalAA-43]